MIRTAIEINEKLMKFTNLSFDEIEIPAWVVIPDYKNPKEVKEVTMFLKNYITKFGEIIERQFIALKEIEFSDEWYGEGLHKEGIFPSEEWESERYSEWKKRVELRNQKEYKEWEKAKKNTND